MPRVLTDELVQGHATSASITHTSRISPTVREIVLHVHDKTMSFEPGQWVDFFIAGMDTIGGYSITSTPAALPKLRLAVKHSKHAPADWVHSKATVGMEVHIRPGGTFYWAARVHRPPLLLIAGGIGATPLMSILRAAAEEAASNSMEWARPSTVQVLYSCSTPAEAAPMLDALHEVSTVFGPGLRSQVHFTKTGCESTKEVPASVVKAGRMGRGDLQDALERAGQAAGAALAAPHVFVCGPPSMTDATVQMLDELGVPGHHVHFEKWW